MRTKEYIIFRLVHGEYPRGDVVYDPVYTLEEVLPRDGATVQDHPVVGGDIL